MADEDKAKLQGGGEREGAEPEMQHRLRKMTLQHRVWMDQVRPLVRSVRRKPGYSAGELGCIATARNVGYLPKPVEEA